MKSCIIMDKLSNALFENLVAQLTPKSGTTDSVLGSVIEGLKEVYGDEELLEVSMDEAQTGLESIDVQPVVNDMTIEAFVIPKMEFRDSALPLVWFLLKTRPNRDKKIMRNTLKVERFIKQKQIGLTYYEGCKRIVQEWGDKIQQYWSLNNEPITCNVEPSYNVSSGNVQPLSSTGSVVEDALTKAVHDAIVAVMERKDTVGEYEFHQQLQWEGIYFTLKELRIYTGTAKGFSDYLKGLGLDGLRCPLPCKSVARHGIWGKVFHLDEWTPKNNTESKIYNIAMLLKNELEKNSPKKRK